MERGEGCLDFGALVAEGEEIVAVYGKVRELVGDTALLYRFQLFKVGEAARGADAAMLCCFKASGIGVTIGDIALLRLFEVSRIGGGCNAEDGFALDEEAGALWTEVAEKEGEGDVVATVFAEGGDDRCARFHGEVIGF